MLSAIYQGSGLSVPPPRCYSGPGSKYLLCLLLLSQFALYQPCLAAAENGAVPQQQVMNIVLPRQALKLSLEQLAKTAGLKIVYRSEIVAGVESPALNGTYNTAQILELLLAGTQLEFQLSDADHVAIRKRKPPRQSADDNAQPHSDVVSEQVPFISETLVVGESHHKTCCRDTLSTATKTLVPSIDVPRSLEGIDSGLFTDRGNALLNEAFRDYTSVLVVDEQSNVNLRGFQVPSAAILVDGLPTISRQIMASPLQNISGIEIAKGVNSALYGHGEPGGLINLVTKKPSPQAFTRLSISYGNYDHYLAVDSNSPIKAIPGLLQRFNGIFRKEVDYGSFDGSAQQIQLNPYIRYEFSEKYRLDLSLTYEEQKLTGRPGRKPVASEKFLNNLYPEIYTRATDLYTFPTGGPDDKQPKEATFYSLRSTLNIDINPQWQQNFSLAYSRASEDSHYRANWNSYAHFLFDPRPGLPYALMKYIYSLNNITAAGNIFLIGQYENFLAESYPSLTPASTANGEWLDVILDNGSGVPYWTDNQFHFYQQVLVDNNDSNLFNGQWNVSGQIDHWGMQHNVLFGTSFQDQHDKNRTRQRYSKYLRALGEQYEAGGEYVLGWHLQRYSMIPWFDPMAAPTSGNIVLPDVIANAIAADPLQEYPLDGSDLYFREDLQTRTYGIYLQDLINLGEQWRVLLSGGWYRFNRERDFFNLNRYAWVTGDNLPLMTHDHAIDTVFAPSAGIVYLPIETLAFYANYGEQFNIKTDRKSDLTIFDPEKSTMHEIGSKWWINSELGLIISYFVLTKENWTVADENALNFLSQDGRLRSEGFEINLSGFLTPHLKIASNYSSHSLRTLSDKGDAELYRINASQGVPDKTGSIWLQYYLQAYGKRGWSFGAGESYISARFVNPTLTTVNLGRAILYDALAAYQEAKYRVSLNVDNLFDEEWYTGKRSDPTNTIFFASPNIFQGFGRRYRANFQWYF